MYIFAVAMPMLLLKVKLKATHPMKVSDSLKLTLRIHQSSCGCHDNRLRNFQTNKLNCKRALKPKRSWLDKAPAEHFKAPGWLVASLCFDANLSVFVQQTKHLGSESKNNLRSLSFQHVVCPSVSDCSKELDSEQARVRERQCEL